MLPSVRRKPSPRPGARRPTRPRRRGGRSDRGTDRRPGDGSPRGRATGTLDPVSIARILQAACGTSHGETRNSPSSRTASRTRKGPSPESCLENPGRNGIEHTDAPVTVTVGVDDGVRFVEDDGTRIHPDARARRFEGGYSGMPGHRHRPHDRRGDRRVHGWTLTVTAGDGGRARFEIGDVEFADATTMAAPAERTR